MTTTLLDPTHRPRLRQTLSAEPAANGVMIFDPHRIGQPIQITALGLEIVRRLDGSRTHLELQAEITRLAGGHHIPLDAFTALVAALDQALLLESPRFHEHIQSPVRKPSCIGCYDADPTKLRTQLSELFTAPGGPGLPEFRGDKPHGSSRLHGSSSRLRGSSSRLRAALLPHMDYARGNITYGWGFKELIEQTDAAVFVIVATSHYSHHRFTLSRQHFESPLGVVETDQAYIDRIERDYGPGVFDDPLAHFPEHSIELEVVLLQYLLENRRPFKIVPLLVGSFGDCVKSGTSPSQAKDIAKMIAALRAAEAACPEKVCYLISGDLAHIGPKFGDRRKAEGPWLEASRTQDDAILADLARADPKRYFETIAGEKDVRRICGLPPTFLTLEVTRPTSGRVLHYQQFVHPQGHESVSFAAAAFYE
jgi:MEMO1 family protein